MLDWLTKICRAGALQSFACHFINEWMDFWINEWIYEWTNEFMNESLCMWVPAHSLCTFRSYQIRHSVRMSLGFCPVEPRNWKWPNCVGNSEMSTIWCISIPNNVKTCKISMKLLKRLTWVFLQGDVDDILELFAKNDENKGN